MKAKELVKDKFWIVEEQGKKVGTLSKKDSNTYLLGDKDTGQELELSNRDITEKYGVARTSRFIALRYFNVYGQGEQNKGRMASVAFQSHRNGKFRLFPGEPKRDFVYIKDVVDATIYPLFNHVNPGVYEVGSGEARTFEDVLNIMNVKYTYRKRSDIPKGYQFFTKANKNEFMDGWEPIYNLEKGLEEYKEYLES